MNIQWSHAHAVIKGEVSAWVKYSQQEVSTPSARNERLDEKPSKTQPSVQKLTCRQPKKECTGELSNAKRARRTGRPVREIAEEAKKSPFTTVGPDPEGRWVCVNVSKQEKASPECHWYALKPGHVCQKKRNRVTEERCRVSKWDKDKLVPEWWEKNMETGRNCSGSKAYHLITEAWWWW